MNKLIKLIYVNILSLFNINQIFIAREEGVKSNFETKAIIMGIILLFFGYLIYNLFDKISLTYNYLLLSVGFLISTLICFIINITSIEPIIFKNNDTDLLFSMPITRQQILFSKLFSIYIKNLIGVFIVMISFLVLYISKVGEISDTFLLIYLITSLTIPFIPMVASSIITYCDDYLKTKYNNNITYKITKSSLVGIVLIIFVILILTNGSSNIETIIAKVNGFYLFSYLFTYSLVNENIIAFIASVGIPILLLYLFYEVISNNYLRICSILKGVKKKIEFKYRKAYNMKSTLGVFRKEIISLFQNKVYLTSSYAPLIGFSFTLFIILKNVDFTQFSDIKFFDLYFNTYLPPILATLVTFSNSSISAMSLEKENLKMLTTMPIKFEKIFLGKLLVNISIGTIFVLINGLITIFLLNLKKIEILLCFLLPEIALIFVSATSLLLDTIFIEKTQSDDNTIIKQRLINLVPMCLSILIGILPILLPLTDRYYFTLGSYIMAMLFILFIEYITFKLKRKSLIEKIIK